MDNKCVEDAKCDEIVFKKIGNIPLKPKEDIIYHQFCIDIFKKIRVFRHGGADEDVKTEWQKVNMLLYNAKAATSFIGDYSPWLFIFLISFVLSGTFKANAAWPTFQAFNFELTEPQALLKLMEGVYMKRHEQDLVGEEELYRMV